jgi:hypothetical protein
MCRAVRDVVAAVRDAAAVAGGGGGPPAARAPGGERGEGAQNMRFRDGREHACDGARTRYRAKPFPTDARLEMRASGKRTCQISDASSRKGA